MVAHNSLILSHLHISFSNPLKASLQIQYITRGSSKPWQAETLHRKTQALKPMVRLH